LRLALALLLTACGAGARSPVGVVRTLAEAAQAGERAEVYQLLGPATRAKLDADARRAAALSGRRAVPPEEMLAVGWFAPRFALDDVRELERSGERATVEVRGQKGERQRITCVRDGGQWRVELP
jgi:hypothetical protein